MGFIKRKERGTGKNEIHLHFSVSCLDLPFTVQMDVKCTYLRIQIHLFHVILVAYSILCVEELFLSVIGLVPEREAKLYRVGKHMHNSQLAFCTFLFLSIQIMKLLQYKCDAYRGCIFLCET